jgi:hypothetical protein
MGQPFEPFAPACECLYPAARGDWGDVFGQAGQKISAEKISL